MQTIDFFSSSANLKNWEWNRLQSLPNGIFFSHLNNRQNDCRVKPIQDSNLCPIQNAMFSFGFGILLCLKSFTFLIFSSLSFPPPGNETIHWILVLHASMYALLPLCPSYGSKILTSPAPIACPPQGGQKPIAWGCDSQYYESNPDRLFVFSRRLKKDIYNAHCEKEGERSWRIKKEQIRKINKWIYSSPFSPA